MSTTNPSLQAGPALWSGGFRPFFLGGAAFAAVALPLWVWALITGEAVAVAGDPLSWHIHEMIFGYVGAVLAGFLLTAIPNWTGRLPVRGRPLMLLFALWLAGRVAVVAGEAIGPAAAAVDAAFLAVLAGVAWREVAAGKNAGNFPICIVVSLFALANICFHLEIATAGAADYSIRAALGIILLLISLIGGRITPSFTRNWLAKRGAADMPAPFGRYDKLCLAATVLAALAWIAAPEAAATAAALALAAALHAVRLLRWRGWAAAPEPILFVLHVAYAWLPVAMVLLAAGIAWPEIGRSPGIHAFTAGGIGMMTLAVMTRATLGHTGHPLTASAGTNAIYLLVFAGALLRVAAPWLPVDYLAAVMVAGGLWTGGFLLFVLIYGPILAGAGAGRE
ncbi:MAG: NnrS family protein [Alphaproteobacteria bacterium]|nr:NnrS family protein [Alphaproteobacteria bacterium]